MSAYERCPLAEVRLYLFYMLANLHRYETPMTEIIKSETGR